MGDDLSARLREKATFWLNLAGTVTAGLLVEAADALDAAPPCERVLPEGVTVEDVEWLAAHSNSEALRTAEPPDIDGSRMHRICRALAYRDSGADPEPQS